MKIVSPYEDHLIEVKFQRLYPGYIYRRELIRGLYEDDIKPYEMKVCYSNYTGHYMGNNKDALYLCKKKGIRMIQKRNPDHNICSIGFNPKESKWYGWSHRACYGFGIGSKVQKGDCAYSSTDKNDFMDDMIRFWSGENHINVRSEFAHNEEYNQDGVEVFWEYDDQTPNEKIRGTISSIFNVFPDHWGRGEWTAETLDDAKQMAIDFAEGVS